MNKNNPFTKNIFYITKIDDRDKLKVASPTTRNIGEEDSNHSDENGNVLTRFLDKLGVGGATGEPSSFTATVIKSKEHMFPLTTVDNSFFDGLDPYQITDDFLIDRTNGVKTPIAASPLTRNLTSRATARIPFDIFNVTNEPVSPQFYLPPRRIDEEPPNPLMMTGRPTTMATNILQTIRNGLSNTLRTPQSSDYYNNMRGRGPPQPIVHNIQPILVVEGPPGTNPQTFQNNFPPLPVPIDRDTDLMLLTTNYYPPSTTMGRALYDTAINYYNLTTPKSINMIPNLVLNQTTTQLNSVGGVNIRGDGSYLAPVWWADSSTKPFYCYGSEDVCNPVLAGSQPCSTGYCDTVCPDQAYWVRGSAQILPILIPVLIALAFACKILIASVIFGRRRKETGTALNVYLGGHTISDILFLICAGILQYMTWVGGGNSSSRIKKVRTDPRATIASIPVHTDRSGGMNYLGAGRSMWYNLSSRFSRIDSYFFALSEAFWLISIYILIAAAIDRCIRWKRKNAGDQKLSVRKCGTWSVVMTVLAIYMFGLATSLPRVWMAHERHRWFSFPNRAVEGSRFYCRMYDWFVILLSTVLPLVALFLLSSFLSHIICRDRRWVRRRAKELKDMEKRGTPAVIEVANEGRNRPESIGGRHPYILESDERHPLVSQVGAYNVMRTNNNLTPGQPDSNSGIGIGTVVTPLRRPPPPPNENSSATMMMLGPGTEITNDHHPNNMVAVPGPRPPPYYTYNVNNNNNVWGEDDTPRNYGRSENMRGGESLRRLHENKKRENYYYGRDFNVNNNNNHHGGTPTTREGYREYYSDPEDEDGDDDSIYTRGGGQRSDFYDVSAEERGILMHHSGASGVGTNYRAPDGGSGTYYRNEITRKRKTLIKKFWARTRSTFLIATLCFLTPLLLIPFALSQIWIHRMQEGGPTVGSIILSQILQCFIYLSFILHLPLLLSFYDRFRRAFYYTCCPCCAYKRKKTVQQQTPHTMYESGGVQVVVDPSSPSFSNKSSTGKRVVGRQEESDKKYIMGGGVGGTRNGNGKQQQQQPYVSGVGEQQQRDYTVVIGNSPETERLVQPTTNEATLITPVVSSSYHLKNGKGRRRWWNRLLIPGKGRAGSMPNTKASSLFVGEEDEDFVKKPAARPSTPMAVSMLSGAASDQIAMTSTAALAANSQSGGPVLLQQQQRGVDDYYAVSGGGGTFKKHGGGGQFRDTIVVMGTSPSTGPYATSTVRDGHPPISVRIIDDSLMTGSGGMEGGGNMVESCYVIPSPPNEMNGKLNSSGATVDKTSTFRKGTIMKSSHTETPCVQYTSVTNDDHHSSFIQYNHQQQQRPNAAENQKNVPASTVKSEQMIRFDGGMSSGKKFDTIKHDVTKTEQAGGIMSGGDVRIIVAGNTLVNGDTTTKTKKQSRERSSLSETEQRKLATSHSGKDQQQLSVKKRSGSHKFGTNIMTGNKQPSLKSSSKNRTGKRVEDGGTKAVFDNEEQSISQTYGPEQQILQENGELENPEERYNRLTKLPAQDNKRKSLPSPPVPSHYQSPPENRAPAGAAAMRLGTFEDGANFYQHAYQGKVYEPENMTPIMSSPSGMIRNIDKINRTHYGYSNASLNNHDSQSKGSRQNGQLDDLDITQEIVKEYIDGNLEQNVNKHGKDRVYRGGGGGLGELHDMENDPYRYGSYTPLGSTSTNTASLRHQLRATGTASPLSIPSSSGRPNSQTYQFYQGGLSVGGLPSIADGDSGLLKSGVDSATRNEPPPRQQRSPRPTYEEVFGTNPRVGHSLDNKTYKGISTSSYQQNTNTFGTTFEDNNKITALSPKNNYAYTPFYTHNRYYARYSPFVSSSGIISGYGSEGKNIAGQKSKPQNNYEYLKDRETKVLIPNFNGTSGTQNNIQEMERVGNGHTSQQKELNGNHLIENDNHHEHNHIEDQVNLKNGVNNEFHVIDSFEKKMEGIEKPKSLSNTKMKYKNVIYDDCMTSTSTSNIVSYNSSSHTYIKK